MVDNKSSKQSYYNALVSMTSLYKELFDDSDSENDTKSNEKDDIQLPHKHDNNIPSLLPLLINDPILYPTIPGLNHYPSALLAVHQATLMNGIISAHYFDPPHCNQSMLFGELPEWLNWIEEWVRNTPSIFKGEVLKERGTGRIFDQAILNLYMAGEGIKSHVDLARFEDGILIISLLSSCVMTFRPADTTSIRDYNYKNNDLNCNEDNNNNIDILLRPGDILTLSGPARYDWEHGIVARDEDQVDGYRLRRGVRVSITLRKVKGEGWIVGEEKRGREGWEGK